MILVLRLLHILSGAFWYGSVIFNARFLIPSLGAIGPDAGAVVAQLNKHKFSQAMMGAAVINVVSGIWLMYIVSGGGTADWMRSSMGRTFAAGGTLTILAMLAGMIISSPAGKRMGQLSGAIRQRGGPPTPEEGAQLTALQGRLRMGTTIVAWLLTLAVAAMAVARYL